MKRSTLSREIDAEATSALIKEKRGLCSVAATEIEQQIGTLQIKPIETAAVIMSICSCETGAPFTVRFTCPQKSSGLQPFGYLCRNDAA